MQFRLTYEGKLPANGPTQHRHEIRKEFIRNCDVSGASFLACREMWNPVRDLVEVNRGPDRSRVEFLSDTSPAIIITLYRS